MSCLSRPRRRAARLSAFAALLLLATTAPVFAQCNSNPDAIIATPNQTVPDHTPLGGNVVVTLDATGAKPNSGNQHPTFAWTAAPGNPYPVALQNANTRIASFVVPDVSGPTALAFTFRITCGDRSDTAVATVNITNVVLNAAPHAAISVSPALIAEGDLVTLDGSGSYDIDNTPNTSGLTYQWTQLGEDGLPVAGGVLLQPSANSPVATFTAPNNPTATAGHTLQFRLTVSDGTLQGTAVVPVVVAWANDPPFAHIVCPEEGFIVGEGEPVVLDGSGSFDHDDGIASYLWTQINGTPDAGITGAATPVLAFNAPALGYGDLGALYFQLQVKDASAADDMGQPAIAECTVFVNDITAPALSLPADMTLDADSAAGTEVPAYAVSALDNVDGDISELVACTPPAPHLFALGTTAVACSVGDSVDPPNVASGSFNVTVSDLSPPVFGVMPSDITMQGDTIGGANVAYDIPAATDKVDADVDVDCVPPPGFFALGSTPVACTATDDAGHVATAGFTVTVYDFVPPEIDGAADQTVEATSPAGAVATFAPTASDVVDDDVTVDCDHASGATFPLGATLVSCSASDDSGNTAHAGFTVSVVDTTAPTLVPPADVTMEATGPLTAVTYGAASATDLVDTDVAIQCLPASGSGFAVGAHTIACTATDDAGNGSSATSTVTVTDTTGPAITVPDDVTVEATSAAGAIATFAASAIDLVDGPRAVHCAPPSGSQFALGATAVACTSSDSRGNASGAGFSVQVVDTTAPTIAPHADVFATATSGAGALVEYDNPAASDLVDGDVQTHCTPASGTQFALGATTLTCTATDDAGNSASSTFTVTVRYAWAGFFRPVDNGVLNSVKAGSAVPVKFSLGGNMGLDIFASGYPRAVVMQCGTGALEDTVEETVNAGGSSLQYDPAANQYIYVWKTEKSWTGSCRQLQLKLADGTTQVANFKFK